MSVDFIFLRQHRLIVVVFFFILLAFCSQASQAKLNFFGKKTIVTPAQPTLENPSPSQPEDAIQKTEEAQPATKLTVPVVQSAKNSALPDVCFKLPEVMLNTLLKLDKNVKLRSDCYAIFSNGQSYLPILPQKLEVKPPTKIVQQWGGTKTAPPDLIQFDNDWYFIKLLPTDTGKLTFARLPFYPTSLKEGVIPQNWFVPAGLSIPAELRVLLGNLDYTTPAPQTPEAKNPIKPENQNANTPQAVAVNVPKTLLQPTYFYTDFLSATLQGIDTATGESRLALRIDTLAASILPVPAGDGVWVASVNQPEIIVVNPVAQLISTRLEAIAPASKLVFSPYNDVVVATHKSKPQLTLFDGKKRLFLGTVPLPSPVATAVMRKRFPIGYFSAVENNAIYEVDVAEHKIIRTLKPAFKTDEQYLTKIDALWLNEPAKGLGQLWLMDKTAKKLQVVQVFTGAVLKTITLPNKPLEWVELVDNRLAVLTENNALLTVIDTKTFEITDSITLAPTTKLPFSLTTNANKTELVVFDGLASQLQVIDLRNLLKPVQLLKAVGRSKQGAFYEPNTLEEETALSDTTLSTEVKAELAALQGLNTQPQRLKRLERLWAKWQSGSRGLH
ncbi:MAG: hypothetical protein H2174_03815 [Vampirovibrio sp.]|nr:hypothetical protein [Vampirovibrio sp.]